jgi:hypothetical protein
MKDTKLRNNTIGMASSFTIFAGIVVGVTLAVLNGVPGDDLNWLFWVAVAMYIAFLVFVSRLCSITGDSGSLYVLVSIFLIPAGGLYTFARMLYNSRQAAHKDRQSP